MIYDGGWNQVAGCAVYFGLGLGITQDQHRMILRRLHRDSSAEVTRMSV